MSNEGLINARLLRYQDCPPRSPAANTHNTAAWSLPLMRSQAASDMTFVNNPAHRAAFLN